MATEIGRLSKRVAELERNNNNKDNKIKELEMAVERVRLNLKEYKNRHSAEIRVLSKSGKWDDYTGVFYLDTCDEGEMALARAEEHFENFFRDGDWYKNRTLGLFLNGPEKSELIEVLKTSDKEKNEETQKEN